MSAGRGRGRGKSRSGITESSGAGRGNKRGASGRGRGRGSKANLSKFFDSTAGNADEEEDELCQLALGKFELLNSDTAKAFAGSRNLTDIPGFDPNAGDVWIYPTNRPVRDYQFNITQTALFHNTLVCLPTGLGKTFVAAVVMYNFHRWYPNDLIIFMAPTKPLVTQQLDACHNIVGIPPSKTVELTGQIPPAKRESLWQEKKVFFLTPQVIQSDIARKSCPADRIRCVVIDEAHKALGNHSFAQVVSDIFSVNKHFRVLALSATPGNDLEATQQVLKNLLISRVELRSDNSPDILPYIHNKEVETVVVSMDDFQQSTYAKFHELYQVYTGKLMKRKILPYNGSNFVAFQLLQARQRYRDTMAASMASYEKGIVEVTFATCISISRALDLLQYHGLRSFYLFLQGLLLREKGSAAVAAELKRQGIEEMLEPIKTRLNICLENSSFNISTSSLFDSISEDLPSLAERRSTDINAYLLSHPKLLALKNIVENHFKTTGSKTRVMIFSQYRDSVQEIGNLLSLLPNVKPMVFMGQAKTAGAGGRGLKQKEQVQVIEKFRSGEFNVLVATSVGEEGLDIGEVDLIICFDSNKSPIRNIQRMGRTGRQRRGRIVFLLAEGKEQRMYFASIEKRSSVNKNITDPRKLDPFLLETTPRMIPTGMDPQCFKMNIILSNEQIVNNDQPKPLEEMSTFDETDFVTTKPGVKDGSRGKKSRLTKTKSATSRSGSPKTTHRTLQQCFQIMEAKKSQSARPVAVETITLDEESRDEPIEEDIDPYEETHVDFDSQSKAEEYEKLRAFLGIEDIDANSEAPACVFIPFFQQPERWGSISESAWKEADVNKIHAAHVIEKVDSSLCFAEEACRCGFVRLSKSQDTNVHQQWSNPARKCINSAEATEKEKLTGCAGISSDNTRNLPQDENDWDDGFIFDENEAMFAEWDSISEVQERSCIDKVDRSEDDMRLNSGTDHSAEGFRGFAVNVAVKRNHKKPCNNAGGAHHVVMQVEQDSDESTASESEWNTSTWKNPTGSDKSTAVELGDQGTKSDTEVTALVTPPSSRHFMPPVRSFESSTTNFPEISHQTSAEQCSKRRFTFKKKQEPRFHFITSFQPEETDLNSSKSKIILAETVLEAPKQSKVQKSNQSSQRACTASPAKSEIDCIPGTSSEDEVDENENIGLLNDLSVIKEKESDCDSDETVWDPDEAVHSVAESSKFKPDLSTSPKKPPPSVANICKLSPRPAIPFGEMSTKVIKTPGVTETNIQNQNFTGSWTSTPTRLPLTASALNSSATTKKSCLSRNGRNLLKALSSSSSASPNFSSEKKIESQIPSSGKPRFQFRRKQNAENVVSPGPCGINGSAFSKPNKEGSAKEPEPNALFDSDDDCIFIGENKNTPSSSPITKPTALRAVSESPEEFVAKRKNMKRRAILSTERPSPKPRVPKPKNRKTTAVKKNPYLFDEAQEASGDDSGDLDSDADAGEDMKSFVISEDDGDDDCAVSASQQQAMYMQSLKDVFPRVGRIEEPLPRAVVSDDEEYDLDDSFCTEDVEYENVGVFTQCMINAQVQIEEEKQTGRSGRRLRPRK